MPNLCDKASCPIEHEHIHDAVFTPTPRPPGIPVPQLRATIALLGDGEVTPTARRLLTRLCDAYGPGSADA